MFLFALATETADLPPNVSPWWYMFRENIVQNPLFNIYDHNGSSWSITMHHGQCNIPLFYCQLISTLLTWALVTWTGRDSEGSKLRSGLGDLSKIWGLFEFNLLSLQHYCEESTFFNFAVCRIHKLFCFFNNKKGLHNLISRVVEYPPPY